MCHCHVCLHGPVENRAAGVQSHQFHGPDSCMCSKCLHVPVNRLTINHSNACACTLAMSRRVHVTSPPCAQNISAQVVAGLSFHTYISRCPVVAIAT